MECTQAAHEHYYARFHAYGARLKLEDLEHKLKASPWLIHTRFRHELKAAQIHADYTADKEIYWERKLFELQHKYDPNQPRVPAGNPDGGQWTYVGGYARGKERQDFIDYLRTGRVQVADSGAIGSDASTDAATTTDPQTDKTDARGRARQKYILQDGGGSFYVAPNPDANPNAPWHENPANSKVNVYKREIDQISAETGVDGNLIRTIMYMETSHGRYFGAGPLADKIGYSQSILPMNINVIYWGNAFGTRSELNIPLNNIRAGARMLNAIIANLEPNASIAKIATLYNVIGAPLVNNYGARAEAVYHSRAWERRK